MTKKSYRVFGTSIADRLLLIVALATFLWLLGTCEAHACADLDVDTESARVVFNGEPGFWFSSDFARCILSDVDELKVRKKEIRILSDELKVSKEETALAENALELSRVRSNELKAQLQALSKQVDQGETFFSSPYFWFVVGLVAGGAMVTLVALEV